MNEHYKHNIINDIMDYGPNLVMFPNVAIAHSRIDAGCLKLGFSFTKLKSPVSFGHKYFDPVSIIFTLSVIDKKTHQTSLLQLFKLLSNAESYNELMNANNKEELIQVFKESERQYKISCVNTLALKR